MHTRQPEQTPLQKKAPVTAFSGGIHPHIMGNPCESLIIRKKLSVFIGRFQPFHNGHEQVVKVALSLGHTVLVLIGSANKPRCQKNPFNLTERKCMIEHTFAGNKDVIVDSLSDFDYDNERWKRQVRRKLAEYQPEYEIEIIGYHKDDSSFYLKEFPEYNFMAVDAHTCDKGEVVHATDIRQIWYTYKGEHDIARVVPQATFAIMMGMPRAIYGYIRKEYQAIRAYLKSWEGAPWPVQLVTTDALVIWKESVLLIKRKNSPGKDLWAMPGGFVDANETIQEGMFRELKEETAMDRIRKRDIRCHKCFDAPNRGERGRTFSHVYLSVYSGDYFKPIAGDDAIEAKWVRLADLKYMCREMYSDHWGIINFMISHRFPDLKKELTHAPATC